MMNIAVIFAGGVGSRMHSKERPKQFLEMYNKPIIIHTLEHFQNHPKIDAIVVVCIESWIPYLNELLYKFRMTKDSRVRYFFQKRLKRILPTYLTVAVPYWIAVDIVCKQRGWTVFAADISFITFFAHGTRTFWYVLFIGLAYLTYPVVYKVLHTKYTEYFQLVVLIMIALLIQLLPKIILLELYSNIEIMLGRFLVFFLGCWCGKKVYQNELINNKEKVGIFFGAGLMLGNCLPITKCVVNKLGYRILMCFWGIFLLYCLTVNLKKIPQRIRWILQRFGNASYELYLTHVAIRAFMNLIGIRTYYLQNYILCVLVSLLLTSIIIKLQRMMIRAT